MSKAETILAQILAALARIEALLEAQRELSRAIRDTSAPVKSGPAAQGG